MAAVVVPAVVVGALELIAAVPEVLMGEIPVVGVPCAGAELTVTDAPLAPLHCARPSLIGPVNTPDGSIGVTQAKHYC